MNKAYSQCRDNSLAPRRTKRLARLTISIAALATGLIAVPLKEPIAAYLGVSEQTIFILGVVMGQVGFFLLATWMSGNEVSPECGEAYFSGRRAKDIARMLIGVTALVIGLIVLGLKDPIAAHLDLPDKMINIIGVVVNHGGFWLLAMWMLDGKE